MTPADVAKVLTKCAAYDRRTIGQADVAAWHEILDTTELVDGLDAVRRHYRATREWAMPADILTHARVAKTERLQRERRANPDLLAIESKFDPAAHDKAAPAFERTAELRAAARERIAEAQRKSADARKGFASAQDALNALDVALSEMEQADDENP